MAGSTAEDELKVKYFGDLSTAEDDESDVALPVSNAALTSVAVLTLAVILGMVVARELLKRSNSRRMSKAAHHLAIGGLALNVLPGEFVSPCLVMVPSR